MSKIGMFRAQRSDGTGAVEGYYRYEQYANRYVNDTVFLGERHLIQASDGTYNIDPTTLEYIGGDGCEFTLDDDDGWDTDADCWDCDKCGNTWWFDCGNPFENDMYFCSKCGEKVVAINWHKRIEDDETGETNVITRRLTRDEYDSGKRLGVD